MPQEADCLVETPDAKRTPTPATNRKVRIGRRDLAEVERHGGYWHLEQNATERAPFFLQVIDVRQVCSACKLTDVADEKVILWLHKLDRVFRAEQDEWARPDDLVLDFEHPDGAPQRRFTKRVLALSASKRRSCVTEHTWKPRYTGDVDHSGESFAVQAGFAERGTAQTYCTDSWKCLRGLSCIQRLELAVRNYSWRFSDCSLPQAEVVDGVARRESRWMGGAPEPDEAGLFIPCWRFLSTKRAGRNALGCDVFRPWLPMLFICKDQSLLKRALQEWHNSICWRIARDVYKHVQPLLAEQRRRSYPNAPGVDPVTEWMLRPNKDTHYEAKLFLEPIMEREAHRGFMAQNGESSADAQPPVGGSKAVGEDVAAESTCPNAPPEADVPHDQPKKLKPSWKKAKCLFEWALEHVEGADSMTYKEIFDSLQHDPRCAGEGLPDKWETFAHYCREAGVRRNTPLRARNPTGSIRRASQLP